VNSVSADWPALPIAAWAETCETLHMLTQIVGKTRLALAPMQNHWWQVALYVTERGLTTSVMPCDERAIAVDFDFVEHSVRVRTSEGAARAIPLMQGSVADFYGEYMKALHALEIDVRLRPVPVEVVVAIPFAEDTQHASYDRDAAQRWWRVMLQADRVMKRFRGEFEGKASPVHFFWGSFDIAATRFSGRGAPVHPGGSPNCPDYVMREAYSRECSSCGFWPGGGGQEAAFYSYAYPEPDGYSTYPVRPAAAYYDRTMREFILPYDAVRSAHAPDEVLLDFLRSTYDAAAVCGKWDRVSLERASRMPT
jgi:hypothetical protein